MATTPGKHRSSLRHLELHAFQVKDFVDNGEINVVWCPGDDCIADVYTKAVDTAKFKRFSSLLLGDGPTTIEKALVVNAVHSYHVDHVLNGKSVCLGVCVWGGGEQDKPLCPDCVCPGPKGTDTSQAAKHFSSCSCASSSKRA